MKFFSSTFLILVAVNLIASAPAFAKLISQKGSLKKTTDFDNSITCEGFLKSVKNGNLDDLNKDRSLLGCTSPYFENVLQVAIDNNQFDTVKKLVDEFGVSVDSCGDQKSAPKNCAITPLFLAAEKDERNQILEFLLTRGAKDLYSTNFSANDWYSSGAPFYLPTIFATIYGNEKKPLWYGPNWSAVSLHKPAIKNLVSLLKFGFSPFKQSIHMGSAKPFRNDEAGEEGISTRILKRDLTFLSSLVFTIGETTRDWTDKNQELKQMFQITISILKEKGLAPEASKILRNEVILSDYWFGYFYDRSNSSGTIINVSKPEFGDI